MTLIAIGLSLDLKGNIKDQIRIGASIYQQKTGTWPDTVVTHPDLPLPDPLDDIGIEVQQAKYVQRHLAYIGHSSTPIPVGPHA